MSFEKYREAIKLRESSGNYKVVNSFGFLGAYQMGKPRLWDCGYSIDGYRPHFAKVGDLKDYNVVAITKKDYLNNELLQDEIFRQSVIDLMSRIEKSKLCLSVLGEFYYYDPISKENKKIDNVTISGLIAGAHLKGYGGLKSFLREKNVTTDGYGTKITEYIERFSGYNIDDIYEIKVEPLPLEYQRKM